MNDWKPVISGPPRPGYADIVHAIEADVATGLLEAGQRLPTHRALARALGVSLGTVTRAYGEAHARGLVQGEVGRGTFIAPRAAENTRWALGVATDRSLVDMSLLVAPAVQKEAPLEQLFRHSLMDAVGTLDLEETMAYQPHAGRWSDREAGAAWIRKTGLEADPSRILVCASAQHAATCALMSIVRAGSVVMTEALTTPGIKDLASWNGFQLHGLPGDEHGLLPTGFEHACRQGVSRVLYTMPVLHNPTTATMPPERREEIAAIARRYDIAIVEDGVHGLLPGNDVKPLSGYAGEAGYYFTSLSKTVAPGIRIGYLHVPAAAVAGMEDAIRATMWMTSPLLADVASKWIRNGSAERIMESRRDEARERQQMARDLLAPWNYAANPQGYHLWLDPGVWPADEFARAARARGVAVAPSSVFAVDRGHVPSRVRVSLSSPAGREELRRGLVTVRELLETPPRNPQSAI